MLIFQISFLQAMVASAYLMLGVLVPEEARENWWIFAIIVVILSTINLFLEWREDKNGTIKKASS